MSCAQFLSCLVRQARKTGGKTRCPNKHHSSRGKYCRPAPTRPPRVILIRIFGLVSVSVMPNLPHRPRLTANPSLLRRSRPTTAYQPPVCQLPACRPRQPPSVRSRCRPCSQAYSRACLYNPAAQLSTWGALAGPTLLRYRMARSSSSALLSRLSDVDHLKSRLPRFIQRGFEKRGSFLRTRCARNSFGFFLTPQLLSLVSPYREPDSKQRQFASLTAFSLI